MSPIKAFFQNKWVWLVMVLNLIAIVVVAVLFISNANKTAVMNFVITPVDAEIAVNGKSGYSNNGEAYYFAPGTYEVKISREPLNTKVITVDLEADHNTTVTTFLSEDGGFEFYKLKENLSSYYVLTEIAAKNDNQTIDDDTSAEDFIEKMQNNFELFSEYLPIVDRTPTGYGLEYGVGYQYDTLMIEDGRYLENCKEILCLYVTDTSGEKEQYAMSVIKKFGFDTDLCQIIYEKVDYE